MSEMTHPEAWERVRSLRLVAGFRLMNASESPDWGMRRHVEPHVDWDWGREDKADLGDDVDAFEAAGAKRPMKTEPLPVRPTTAMRRALRHYGVTGEDEVSYTPPVAWSCKVCGVSGIGAEHCRHFEAARFLGSPR